MSSMVRDRHDTDLACPCCDETVTVTYRGPADIYGCSNTLCSWAVTHIVGEDQHPPDLADVECAHGHPAPETIRLG